MRRTRRMMGLMAGFLLLGAAASASAADLTITVQSYAAPDPAQIGQPVTVTFRVTLDYSGTKQEDPAKTIPKQFYTINVPDGGVIESITGGGPWINDDTVTTGHQKKVDKKDGANPGATFDVTAVVRFYKVGPDFPITMTGSLVCQELPGGGQVNVPAGGAASASDSVKVVDGWRAWPGGQTDTTLNPVEEINNTDLGLDANDDVDWDVTTGETDGVIVNEAGVSQGGTATAKKKILVRYDTQSATSADDKAVVIKATKNGTPYTIKRTVFKAAWQGLNFNNALATANQLDFPNDSGTNTKLAGSNYLTNGATRVAGKMEAILVFSPSGIDWMQRGVNFVFGSDDPVGKQKVKGSFRLQRQKIGTWVTQPGHLNTRGVETDDANWVPDRSSDDADTQYPTAKVKNSNQIADPDHAYRIDAPGIGITNMKQFAARTEFQELGQWYDARTSAFKTVTTLDNAEWYFIATGELPNATTGTVSAGPKTDGLPGLIPNTAPVANAGPPQTVNSGAVVQLAGSGKDNADNDYIDPSPSTSYNWTIPAGSGISFNTTLPNPRFTAPTVAVQKKFTLKLTVTETKIEGLHAHRPTNTKSQESSVEITVNP